MNELIERRAEALVDLCEQDNLAVVIGVAGEDGVITWHAGNVPDCLTAAARLQHLVQRSWDEEAEKDEEGR